jgi:redox-sensitive bicupin YhaK (pirin superfamily)
MNLKSTTMKNDHIIEIKDLGFQWKTSNPFLFCVHHKDHYPRGNGSMGPEASLKGRMLGNDFKLKDGWRMYHGREIPGFPQHPHRGFETVTIVLDGMVDHADSLGAAGRYGHGDAQWMTAGAGIQHCEMFPLLNTEQDNPLELFQIWLNLPAGDKFVDPHYKMLWAEQIPKHKLEDNKGKSTTITVVAGSFGEQKPPAPPPDSRAAKEENEISIWLLRMEAGATCILPAASEAASRSLYFHRGKEIRVAGQNVASYKSVNLHAGREVLLENGPDDSHILMLQGRPIEERVVQYGPFVMNSEDEIQQAYADYRRSGFGGWPWPKADQAHDPSLGRFARYADGREEVPG